MEIWEVWNYVGFGLGFALHLDLDLGMWERGLLRRSVTFNFYGQ